MVISLFVFCLCRVSVHVRIKFGSSPPTRFSQVPDMMSLKLLTLTLGLLEASALVTTSATENLVLHNATVYTLFPHVPYASAVCIENGRIAAVGNLAEVIGSSCAKASGAHSVTAWISTP